MNTYIIRKRFCDRVIRNVDSMITKAEKARDKVSPPGTLRDEYLGKAFNTGVKFIPPELVKVYAGIPLNKYEKLRLAGYITASAGGAAGCVGAGIAGLALVVAGNGGQLASGVWKNSHMVKKAADNLKQTKEQGVSNRVKEIKSRDKEQHIKNLKQTGRDLADLGSDAFLGQPIEVFDPKNPPKIIKWRKDNKLKPTKYSFFNGQFRISA